MSDTADGDKGFRMLGCQFDALLQRVGLKASNAIRIINF